MNPQERFQRMVGERIRFARDQVGLTQQQLSDRLGFKDRQILANIEGGKRKVAADELVTVIGILKKPLEFFTDPFLLVGEGAFSWRADASLRTLDAFEEKSRGLIAAFRELCRQAEQGHPLAHQLRLTKRSTFEEAWAAAETLSRAWRLGEVPAARLTESVDRQLGIAVLHVDAPAGISGAACHLPEVNVILINRNEHQGRRHYDLAHELFHILTWAAMPPERVERENVRGDKKARVEYLAENFAGALLLQRAPLERVWQGRGETNLNDFIRKTAEQFLVSGKALYYRLKNLGWITTEDQMEVNFERMSWQDNSEKPKLYSQQFVGMLHERLTGGWLTVRRVAQLLDCTIEDLAGVFQEYGLKPPFEL